MPYSAAIEPGADQPEEVTLAEFHALFGKTVEQDLQRLVPEIQVLANGPEAGLGTTYRITFRIAEERDIALLNLVDKWFDQYPAITVAQVTYRRIDA